MSQVSVLPATAHGRSAWSALRPLLLLGGFVAIWWAVMTGVAHAESTPHHDLVDSTLSQVKAHHDAPARDHVGRHHVVKATTSKATAHVGQQTTPVTEVVAPAITTTPLSPVAADAAKAIRTGVSDTVAKTRSLLAKTTAGPVPHTVESSVEMAESSTGQGNSPSLHSSARASQNATTGLLSASLGQLADTSAAPDETPASTDAGAPVNGPRGAPSVPDPCASPSGSSSSSFTPVGISESSLLVMPSVLRDHHPGRLARLSGGPAHDPGSSPD